MSDNAMRDLRSAQSDSKCRRRRFYIPLSTTQFCQTLLPYRSELNFDFQTSTDVTWLSVLKLCTVPRQQVPENFTKVPAEAGE